MKQGTQKPLAKAVFIDRDGTLNDMVYDPVHGLLDSPHCVEMVRMKKGAGGFLRQMKQLGYCVVVVTNQPGIAKETLSLTALEAVNLKLSQLLEADGATWDAIYLCPHHPGEAGGPLNGHVFDCECRKPKPGMLLTASRELGIDMAASWMIGDGLNDIQAGRAAGCRTMLVTRLKLEQVELFFDLRECIPDAVVASFDDALRVIRVSC